MARRSLRSSGRGSARRGRAAAGPGPGRHRPARRGSRPPARRRAAATAARRNPASGAARRRGRRHEHQLRQRLARNIPDRHAETPFGRRYVTAAITCRLTAYLAGWLAGQWWGRRCASSRTRSNVTTCSAEIDRGGKLPQSDTFGARTDERPLIGRRRGRLDWVPRLQSFIAQGESSGESPCISPSTGRVAAVVRALREMPLPATVYQPITTPASTTTATDHHQHPELSLAQQPDALRPLHGLGPVAGTRACGTARSCAP